jgi:hypothetical protein
MRIRLGVAMAASLLAGGMLAGQSSSVQVYIVPNHGSLRLSIPVAWAVESTAIAEPATLFLHIAPAKGKTFDAQLTVLWLTPANQATTTPESIQANTGRTGNGVLLQAVEKTLMLQELHGSESIGTYYALTDRKPSPGEFRDITQGSFRTGELLSVFTIRSSNPSSAEVKQLLRMLTDATYVKASGAVTPAKP